MEKGKLKEIWTILDEISMLYPSGIKNKTDKRNASINEKSPNDSYLQKGPLFTFGMLDNPTYKNCIVKMTINVVLHLFLL